MHLAGTSSWRLEVKESQLCELALFVRDAAGLTVAGVAGDVPALRGAVPALSPALNAEMRRAASDQWRSWWVQILDFEFRDGVDDPVDARARVRQLVSEHEAICDPPAFESLSDRPALQAAVRAGFPELGVWESSRPRPGREGRPVSSLQWSVIKQVAEDVAFDRQVSPEAVRAKVAVLRVQGAWWRRFVPGAVLCSPSAAADRSMAQALLRDAFDSYLMRAGGSVQ